MQRRGNHCLLPASLMLSLLSTACDQVPANDELFPLAKGHAWTYTVTTHFQGQAPFSHELTITTTGSDTINGQTVWQRFSDNGMAYWLRSDETGIYRVGSKHALDTELAVDQPPRYVVKKPYQVDTSWESYTTSYVLRRSNQVPKRISALKGYKSFPMQYRIAEIDVDIETTAAKFTGCIHVVGDSQIRLYVDAQFAWREMPLTTSEWYCPNVGLVKLVRDEPSPSRFTVGGTYTMELARWY